MAINQTGIAIVIKAWLPTGKSLDEQFEALSLVKDAHATGDYSKVLAASKIDEVKAEQKTRRVEEDPEPEAKETTAEPAQEPQQEQAAEPAGTVGGTQMVGSDEPDGGDVPEFLKKKGKAKAA